jgi:histidine kinase
MHSPTRTREQLAASRARIVEAGDAERRRLERNLHDGAQQRLVRLALCLREVEANLDEEPAAARRYLASAREELALALQELRELAHGLDPAILSDRGLRPALDALVARAPVAVQLTELPQRRLPESVEVAAYYRVVEALTNVAKHACITEARVRIAQTDKWPIASRPSAAGCTSTVRPEGEPPSSARSRSLDAISWVGAPAKATLADRAKHARLGNRGQCRVGIGDTRPLCAGRQPYRMLHH